MSSPEGRDFRETLGLTWGEPDRTGPPTRRKGPPLRMETIRGIPVSPGIVIGRVFVLDDERRRISRRQVPRQQVEQEIGRLDRALEASLADLQQVKAVAQREMGEEAANVFGFHIGVLSDPTVIEPIREHIRREAVAAEYAVYHAFDAWARKFAAHTETAFSTKVDDFRDLATRILHHLIGEHGTQLEKLNHQAVVVARDLTPSQAASFDREKVIAFATDLGGLTSHTAILARALGIPAVVGCNDLMAFAGDGVPVIVDGDRGHVILDPDEETLERYDRYIEQRRLVQLSFEEMADLPAVTKDGVEIELLGNIEFPEEASAVLHSGGVGVGLYRTEFLYLTRDHEPTLEEHVEAYRKCVELLKGAPLTIRTVDLGADKHTQRHMVEPERNPFLGCRSIRFCLNSVPMFKRQLRAILQVSALGPVRVMFPLVTSIGEFRRGKMLLADVMEDLHEEGVPFDAGIRVGMMVEVPSAALTADVFAREVDFFSIGTNDLVQYTLAVDRTNERVAHMFNPAHPAVLRLIREVMRSARRRDLPVSCCGEAAGELDFAALLLGLGLRTLSVTPSSIPRLKRLIRTVTIPQCERIARRAISFDSDVEVAAYVRDQARKIIPDAFDGRSVETGV